MKHLAWTIAATWGLLLPSNGFSAVAHLPSYKPPVGSGIYKSASDFRLGKLTLSVNCQDEKHRVRLHTLFGKPNVDIVHEGKKYTFQKDEIFGFRDCDSGDFRFFNREEFTIREVQSLVIYERQVSRPGVSGKGLQQTIQYFFSTGLEAPIQPLTKSELKKALPNNHPFHDKLDAQFPGEEVSGYDSFHKTFKVNHLLKDAK